jgi:hypothetical protein
MRTFSGRIVNRRPPRSRMFDVPTKPAMKALPGRS